jgi:hypothetical protein
VEFNLSLKTHFLNKLSYTVACTKAYCPSCNTILQLRIWSSSFKSHTRTPPPPPHPQAGQPFPPTQPRPPTQANICTTFNMPLHWTMVHRAKTDHCDLFYGPPNPVQLT